MNPNVYSLIAGTQQNEALRKMISARNPRQQRSLALELYRIVGAIISTLVRRPRPKRSPLYRSVVKVFAIKKISAVRRDKISQDRPAQCRNRRITPIGHRSRKDKLTSFEANMSDQVDRTFGTMGGPQEIPVKPDFSPRSIDHRGTKLAAQSADWIKQAIFPSGVGPE